MQASNSDRDDWSQLTHKLLDQQHQMSYSTQFLLPLVQGNDSARGGLVQKLGSSIDALNTVSARTVQQSAATGYFCCENSSFFVRFLV
jgi:hypothetical protein